MFGFKNGDKGKVAMQTQSTAFRQATSKSKVPAAVKPKRLVVRQVPGHTTDEELKEATGCLDARMIGKGTDRFAKSFVLNFESQQKSKRLSDASKVSTKDFAVRSVPLRARS